LVQKKWLTLNTALLCSDALILVGTTSSA